MKGPRQRIVKEAKAILERVEETEEQAPAARRLEEVGRQERAGGTKSQCQ